jgi:hypothetical protein
MPADEDRPGTKREFDQAIGQLKSELQEFMRDMQTELLRGFERYLNGINVRMRKIEADQSNLDSSATVRLANLEERVQILEQKLLQK